MINRIFKKKYKPRFKKLYESLYKKNIAAFLIVDHSNIFYLTGLNINNCFLMVRSSGKNYIFTDSRFKQEVLCLGKEFEIIISKYSVLKQISKICQKFKIKKLAVESKSFTVDKFNKLKTTLKSIEIVPESGLVEKLRIIKEKSEINDIKKSVEILNKLYKKLDNLVNNNVTEWELANLLEFRLKKDFKTNFSFTPIIASGKNTSHPHAKLSHKPISKSSYILIDIGVKFNGYNSDLTRLYVLSKMNHNQKQVYQIITELQEELFSLIKPGLKLSKIDNFYREKLINSGFAENIMHSVGHGVGLDVHETPRISYNSKKRVKSGMVLTIEPGLYFPDKWGMRIEDMVLVTDSGCEILTDKIPK